MRPADSTPAADALAHVAVLPGVQPAVDRARDAVDELRRHRVLRHQGDRVTAESALRGARASAALEGVDLPLDVVRRTVAASGGSRDDGEPVLQGALRLATELGPLRPTWSRAPVQVLARLHALAAAGQVDDDSLGRPAPAAAARLHAVGDLLTRPSAGPALVLAAIVHAELATMGAFAVGAGLVARASARLTYIDRGLDPDGIAVPEVGHLELGRDDYRAALQGYADGGPDGIAAWVVHCAEAVVLGAREGLAVCESIRRAR